MHRVGVDLNQPTTPSGYEEELVGNVFALAELLPGRRFDTIICGEFIEHIENPYELLRTLREVLSPGGRLLMSTPNPLGFPVVALEYLRSRTFFYTKEHVYYFSPRWAERLLERCGFSVREVAPVGLWLPVGFVPFPIVSLSYQVIYVAEAEQGAL